MHARATTLLDITLRDFLYHDHLKPAMAKHWLALPQYAWARACCEQHVMLGGEPRLDALIHLETIEQDLNQLPWVNDDWPVPHINATRYSMPCWWEQYRDSEEKFVEEIYAKDFEFFGYDPDFDATVNKELEKANG